MSLLTTLFLCIISTIITTTIPTNAISNASLRGNNDTDRVALLAIKSKIIQDPHEVLSSWNGSIHFCQWQGVICGHRHKRVTGLILPAKSLVGTLSPFVGNLSFLQELTLSNNTFTGHIPPQIGHLHRLKKLALINNAFEGEIPANISNCVNLTSLVLSRNNLVGKIPVELGSLTKLEILGLDFNNLTGGLFSIANLTSLQTLALSGQGVQGVGFQAPIPHFIGKFVNLRVLALGDSNFTGTIPPSLYNLSSLEVFSLSKNQLHGSLPPDLGLYFPKLRTLELHTNQFHGPVPTSLSNLSKIGTIDISSTNISGKFQFDGRKTPQLSWLNLMSANLGTGGADDLSFVDTLVNCSQLEVLQIGYNFFGGLLPHSIANLSATVRGMFFSGNRISGTIPRGLGSILNLQILGLSDNHLTGSIPSDIGELPLLQQATFSNNNLSGYIPSSFGNLSRLSQLYLAGNRLQGNIPASLGSCKSLLSLDLRKNNLSGEIPRQLFQASSLTVLIIYQNQLHGSLPSEIGELTNLQVLAVYYNNLSGEIPNTVGRCLALTVLFLDDNSFDGSIPSSFSNLKSLQFVDLSSNKLSGQVPSYFADFRYLAMLNLSFNDLEGEVPTRGAFSNLSAVSLEGNNKLCGGISQLKLPRCAVAVTQVEKPKTRKLSPKFIAIISIACVLVGLSMVSFIYLLFAKKRRKASSSEQAFKESFPKVSYDMLLKATDGFSHNNLIGAGGFGSVYKGKLVDEGVEKDVAIKVFNIHQRGASKSFIAECEALRIIRHRNLVGIITACSSIDFQGNDFKALVYEFMPNGSLEKWLHHNPSTLEQDDQPHNLSLLQRIDIASDVAYALDYIHNASQTPIIHCDLKPSNILLDKDMTAHVGDFGLAKLLPEISEKLLNNSSSVGIRGTVGYAAPEYGVGIKVTAASDIYSYGIMLIEMITAKRPTDPMFGGDLNLHNLAKLALPDHFMEIVDPRLTVDDNGKAINDCGIQCIKSMIEIGVECSLELPQDRMHIKDAITQLQSAKDQLLLCNKAHKHK